MQLYATTAETQSKLAASTTLEPCHKLTAQPAQRLHTPSPLPPHIPTPHFLHTCGASSTGSSRTSSCTNLDVICGSGLRRDRCIQTSSASMSCGFSVPGGAMYSSRSSKSLSHWRYGFRPSSTEAWKQRTACVGCRQASAVWEAAMKAEAQSAPGFAPSTARDQHRSAKRAGGREASAEGLAHAVAAVHDDNVCRHCCCCCCC